MPIFTRRSARTSLHTDWERSGKMQRQVFGIMLHRTFEKILVAFTALILPLYVVLFFTHGSSIDAVTSLIERSVEDRANYFIATMDREIQRILGLQVEYIVDRDVQSLATGPQVLSDFQRIQAVLNIQRRLTLVRKSSPYVAEVMVMIRAIDRTVASEDFRTHIDTSLFDALAPNSVSGIHPFRVVGESIFLAMPFPRYYFGEDLRPLYVVSVEIDTQAVESALASLVSELRGRAVLAGPHDEWTIVAPHTRPSNDDVDSLLEVRVESKVFPYSLRVAVPRKPLLGRTQRFTVLFILGSIVSVLAVGLFAYLTFRLIHEPLVRLVHGFTQVEDGNFGVELHSSASDEFHYLFESFNSMSARIRDLVESEFHQKIRAQRAELKRLQSQINPHFLFNSLFVLYRLAKPLGDARLTQYVRFLTEYFQFVTRDQRDFVSIAEDVAHAQAYARIQRICYGDRFEVSFPDPPAPVSEVQIPRLSVQPVVENAYKYALEPKSGRCILRVSYGSDVRTAWVEVSDNGEDIDDAMISEIESRLKSSSAETEETSGLVNVHRRIRGAGYPNTGISIERNSMHGLSVRITVHRTTQVHP